MWKEELDRMLPLLGHRNWILVVDKAFPLQNASGITLFNTGEPLGEVLKHTLEKITEAPHLKPIIYLDQELESMTEELAIDVEKLREDIKEIIARAPDCEQHTILHEEVFSKLDTASKLFHVVVLKTESLIPYTSVFIELDCGYWSAGQEKRLREKMSRKEE